MRFFFNSEEAANHAYQVLQEMAAVVAAASDDPSAVLAGGFPPPTRVFDALEEQPELLSREEIREWQRQINGGADLSDHEGWNNFTRNVARFGDAYHTLMMYDFADGALNGEINFGGAIQQFSFGNLETCDNGVTPEDSSDMLQCQPANFWRMGATEDGEASFYSVGFEGRKTASETTYDTTEYTVAHRTLPLGTMIQVCSGEQCAMAMVTDRGPYADDNEGNPRIVDLSPAVFQALGHELTEGVIQVSLTVFFFPEEKIFSHIP